MYFAVKYMIKFALMLVYRVKVVGRENIPSEGGLIICPNHRSNLDVAIILPYFPGKLSNLAKEELFRNPLAGWFFKRMNAFPVRRGETDVTAMKTAIKLLTGGSRLLLFPQGTRKKEINVSEAKHGVAFLSNRTQSPILPIGIVGGYRIFSRITLRIGKPIYPDKHSEKRLTSSEMQEISQGVLQEILNLTEQGL